VNGHPPSGLCHLKERTMAKHSKSERERRKAQSARVAEIEAAWIGSVPTAAMKAFTQAVEAARARGPLPRPADMAPGTRPNPPRPGHEPRPPKDAAPPRRNRD
jgi:hypothetical protein